MPEPDPKSTQQPKWPCEVFRESFLSNFVRPDYEAALRLLADVAALLVSEGRDYIDVKDSDLWTHLIRGAVGDLRQAANQLFEVARDLGEAGSGGAEVMRAVLAISDASGEVAPVADRLDAALAAFLATTEA